MCPSVGKVKDVSDTVGVGFCERLRTPVGLVAS